MEIENCYCKCLAFKYEYWQYNTRKIGVGTWVGGGVEEESRKVGASGHCLICTIN